MQPLSPKGALAPRPATVQRPARGATRRAFVCLLIVVTYADSAYVPRRRTAYVTTIRAAQAYADSAAQAYSAPELSLGMRFQLVPPPPIPP